MTRTRFSALLVVTVAAVLMSPSGRRPQWCASDVTRFLAPPWVTYFWGVPQSDTLVAGRGPVRPSHSAWAGTDTSVFGQRFEVLGYGGAGAAVLDSVFKATGRSDVVVVLWGHDDACEPMQRPSSARWAVPGYHAFLSVQLREDSLWAVGRPTFDSFWSGGQVYPHLALEEVNDLGLAPDTFTVSSPSLPGFPRSLTAFEVFQLVEQLPKVCDWYYRPTEAADALLRVKQRHPDLEASIPGGRILEKHEAFARDRAEGRTSPGLERICAA